MPEHFYIGDRLQAVPLEEEDGGAQLAGAVPTTKATQAGTSFSKRLNTLQEEKLTDEFKAGAQVETLADNNPSVEEADRAGGGPAHVGARGRQARQRAMRSPTGWPSRSRPTRVGARGRQARQRAMRSPTGWQSRSRGGSLRVWRQ